VRRHDELSVGDRGAMFRDCSRFRDATRELLTDW
jgi:hypothetical protein